MGRPAANTKLLTAGGDKRIHNVRVRGGNYKYRALRLDAGNFSWPSEAISRKARILDVVYNATSNELVRTKTLVKSAVVQIDAAPLRQYYKTHYGIALGKDDETEKVSSKVRNKRNKRKATRSVIDPAVAKQFATGRLYARISSRPGQCGRADGYILEGDELEFVLRKLK